MTFSEVIKQSPRFIQARFQSLGTYIRIEVEERQLSQDERTNILSRIDTMTIIALVFTLRGFLLDGTQAARQAVRAFRELGISKFDIGSASFSEGSEDVERGRILAEALMESISDNKVRAWISECRSLGQLVRRMVDEFLGE